VDIVGFTFKELTMKGVRVYAPYDFERAIQIIASGKLDLRKILSDPFFLEDAETAFGLAKRGEDVMKVLFSIG
jgi:threonine dehydrogenase-like Zn-dependent dehydrogenase